MGRATTLPQRANRATASLTLAAAVLCAAPAQAQNSDTATASASLMQDLTLTKTRDLDFGDIVVPRNGRLDLTPRANATCTTNNGLIHLGLCQSAAFEGTATQGFQLSITVPNRRRFNITGPGRPLRVRRVTVGDVTGLQFQGRSGNVYNYNVTAADGAFAFHIGARLLFRNNQAPGVYNGTFNITAEYP
jgi:hypothetical protein